MKNSIIPYVLLPIFLFTIAVSAQKDYKGRVIDGKSKEPIPYVNIGIKEAGVGTVSDEDGLFHLYLDLNKYEPTAKILFSALGYETLFIPIADIKLVYNEYPDIVLKPKTVELSEVVVSNKGERFIPDNIGYRNYGDKIYGYWKDNIALGGELATRIIAKSGLRKLNEFEFEVWYNPSDSLLVRINIYEDDGKIGKPGTNLNTSGKNIITTIRKDDRMVRVDLRPYEIYTKDDFIASVELIQVYGEEDLGLILSATIARNGSYRKYASQDAWEYLSPTNMAYNVKSDLMVSEKQAQRFERRTEKKKMKQPTLSGFVIMRGRMISEVNVLNNTTKESVVSDANGRYVIRAKKGDILTFSKDGLKDFSFRVTDKITQNAVMKSK
ncbi:hypothetical protein GCM10011414_11840 [Croceivirga lutea]|uniref:carboxypeptidase-like regulatory domain-containing protein n=1 Tax=Croceivirga lutea TaxID=1775167 RepID=UPI0016395A20|nr:carboxypeptidase-like regulatory domain-containing protein [Croceivirga lutea]GGG43833.1 hypothetical protein GCM10011414_11840 [Croceivirga lutea]